MRKLLLVSGLLAGSALLTGGPALAATGCACATLTSAPVCVASIDACIAGMHGICVAPCDYHPPMKKMRHHKKKSMKKM